MAGLKKLAYIQLSNNSQISDIALLVQNLKMLERLDLSYTQIDDAGLQNLTSLRRLEWVNLTGTQATLTGIARLRATLPPRCHIEFGDSTSGNERAAVQWVLSLGGQAKIISVDGQEYDVVKFVHPRAGKFLVKHVNLASRPGVTDSGLKHLERLTSLESVTLSSTGISNAGLVHLQGQLNLTGLWLDNTKINDDGLVYLKGLANLTTLDIYNTQVGDAGVEHLKGLTNLTYLHLANTQISNDGLLQLKGLTNLTHLFLQGTKISDAGLEHLKGLTKLSDLRIRGTQATAEGIADLMQALPKCEIDSRGK